MHNGTYLCLTELLDQDLSAYEYFQGLDSRVQDVLRREDGDVSSLEQLQNRVAVLLASNFTE